jgi:glycosyltransferase involved in cell wall biosynthesis
LNCDVLFVPGGSFSTNYRSVVTMSQNILPFDWHELWRYGFSLLTLKLFLLRFIQTLSFRRAEGVIFLTDYARQGVLQVTGPLSGATRVIPHGLNPRFLISDDDLTQRKLPAKGEAIRLIYVSIIDQYKHQWNVVEGVAMARKSSGLDLRLDLIGPSYAPALKRLNAAITEHDPHGEWVHYHGAIDYQELHSFYEKATIGIWASSCETFGLILLEMMGAGLPVLSSDRGPMQEILGDTGLFFDPQNPESLSVALLELLESEEKMDTLRRAAHQKVKAYSWERCAIETFSFLCHVAEAQGASKKFELNK